jgi:FAD/FMN-containing dehydrogenase
VQAELWQVSEALRAAETAAVEPESPVEIAGISGTDVWAHFLGRAGDAVHVRIAVPVRDLPVYMQDQSALLSAGNFLVDFAGGFVYYLFSARDNAQLVEMVEQVRTPALQAGGYAVITHVPQGWQAPLDRWGYRPETLDLMRGLKTRWDPAGILNAGSFLM